MYQSPRNYRGCLDFKGQKINIKEWEDPMDLYLILNLLKGTTIAMKNRSHKLGDLKVCLFI